MRRRGKAGQPAKGQRVTRPKARKAAAAHIAIADLQKQLDHRTLERDEALEQLAASSEVLKVISSSPGELGPVFLSILENATQICEAKIGILFRYESGTFTAVATLGVAPAYAEYLSNGSISPGPTTGLGRVASTKQTIHVLDTQAEGAYAEREPLRVATAELGGARTLLNVPMIKEGELIGAIGIYRQYVRPFTDKQIELVTNFAAQAVIAIENARLFNELRQRTDDLSESLEQQTATSEVLQVISKTPGELEPVFEVMLANAVRICGAKFGIMHRYEADGFRLVAAHNTPAALSEFQRNRGAFQPRPGTPLETVWRTKEVAQVADDAATSNPSALATLGGARSHLVVPMLKNKELTGAIAIYRQEVKPFTNKEIELVKNFAAQAVIAIENTRLLNELRESLAQQTATADVLRIISASLGELEPVFSAILQNATRICEAKFGTLYRFDGRAFYHAAGHGTPDALIEAQRSQGHFVPEPGTLMHRVMHTRAAAHSADYAAESARGLSAKFGGARSTVVVPMLKDNALVGAFAIYRQEVRPFTEKQIALLENFAAQAVIAIENTRLLNELRESLEQQTATSEVLKVISSSPGTLEPVFDAMLENATRICEGKYGNLFLREGDDGLRAVAVHGDSEYANWFRREPLLHLRDHPGTPLDRSLRTKAIVHIHDLRLDESYRSGNPRIVALADTAGARSQIVVPMLKDDQLIGALVIYRTEVRPFSEKQIELLTNFAAQAVIAIENTRLLNELRESLQRQTATADVLKVISRSTFDLPTVLQTLVESAARLCGADKAQILRPMTDAHRFYAAASYGYSAEYNDYLKTLTFAPGREGVAGRVLLERKPVQIADVLADSDYRLLETQRLGGFRTHLGLPLLREGNPIGILVVSRVTVQPFDDKHIELLATFADQAVIAIENVRLFESVEARTRELATSLEDLRTTQDRLVQTQKLASLGQLTAGIAHEIKNPLNFVNNFSGVSAELIDELRDTLKGPLDDKARAEINELTDTLRSNLDKVMQHGKRADAIVKNMLLHSREGSGEHRVVDINALVEESLNLAYHGARAEKQGFNITLERSFDAGAGTADLFPQEITRVLLNLIVNGFYAATKRKAEAGGNGYEPTLTAATRSLGDSVEISIRDNGTGIPPDVKEKIFNPFFTTKPAGEGTGLGLSISHDIIVKQHGGSIEVETELGEYTEFRIILPRAAAFVTASGAQS